MNLDVDTFLQKKMELRDQTPKMTTKHYQTSVSKRQRSFRKRLFKLSKTKQSLKRILQSLLNLLLKKKKKLQRAACLSTPKSVTKLTEMRPMPSLGS